MLALAARLQQRNRALRAQELSGEVHGERALPIAQRDVFARRRRACDAGVVHAARRGRPASDDNGVEEARNGRRDPPTSQTLCVNPGSLSANASSAAVSTSQTCTRAPSRAKARAVASPMPEAPAVTSTRKSRIFRSIRFVVPIARRHQRIDQLASTSVDKRATLHYNCERSCAIRDSPKSRATAKRRPPYAGGTMNDSTSRVRRGVLKAGCRSCSAGRAGISRDQPRPGGGDPHRAPDAAAPDSSVRSANTR